MPVNMCWGYSGDFINIPKPIEPPIGSKSDHNIKKGSRLADLKVRLNIVFIFKSINTADLPAVQPQYKNAKLASPAERILVWHPFFYYIFFQPLRLRLYVIG